MKKLLALFLLIGALTLGLTSAIYAQDDETSAVETEQTTAVSDDVVLLVEEGSGVPELTFHQAIKTNLLKVVGNLCL